MSSSTGADLIVADLIAALEKIKRESCEDHTRAMAHAAIIAARAAMRALVGRD